MSRKFKLSNDWYGEDGINIFGKTYITINPGLTVLVGCNGAGKTTLLRQIFQSLENKDIPVMLHNNMSDGERELKSRAAFYGDFEMVARIMASSEGENIVNVMETIAHKMGEMARHNPEAKELWYLFDAIDSGLSVDNVVDIKEVLIRLVIDQEKDKDVYFVISANEYELARNERCFDVMNCKYITFKDYEDYREFILKSKEHKLKRYEE